MPISTSGVSVPQLGQNVDPSIYGSQNAPKPTTLADMLDISNKSVEFQKKKALLPSEIETGQAQAQKATAEANTAQLQNFQAHLTNTIQDQQRLINKPDLTAQDIIDSVKLHAKNAGTPDAAVQQALAGLPASGNPSQLKAWLAQSMARSLNAQGQLDALYPKPTQTNLGGTTAPLTTGNPLLTGQAPGVQAGPATALGLTPGTELVAQPGDNSGLPPGTKYLVGGGQVGGSAVGGQGGVTPDQMNKPANQQRPAVSKLSPQTETNLEIGNNLVNTSREQAGKAVQIESAANQAIQLSQVTDTGQGAQLWNALKGNYVGIPEFNPKNPAANFDILGHVLTNETNLLAQNPAYGAGKMGGTGGGGTGKQIEQAVQTAGKTTWNPEAIQYTSRYNRALAYGVQMFNHGVDQSQTISNGNSLYANEYQQKWNSNLNLDSIRLADAKRNAGIDPQGLTQITKELGGEKSQRYKKAQEDLRIINGLATRGK
jgi:spore coat protein CotF